MVEAYQAAGGSPDRYLVQSWYNFPVNISPETTPYSMTSLVEMVAFMTNRAAFQTGDFDMDVDGNDLLIWQRGFPTAAGATPLTGDADGDGDVDIIDLRLWRNNYSTDISPSVESGATPVPLPEPSTWMLLTLGIVTLRGISSVRST